MKISFKEWTAFVLAALILFAVWYRLEYPHFKFIELPVTKKEALAAAEAYLKEKGVDTRKYSKAVVFESDDWPDRYLQKTIGASAEEDFIKSHDYDLFYWRIRFFRQFQKEEYTLDISCKSKDVIAFDHSIEDIEPRPEFGKEEAKKQAEAFLAKTCGLNLGEFDFHEEQVKRYEKRVDYYFSWEKKGVYIPWKEHEGSAKLLTGVTVSGFEVRDFYKSNLDIPEKFRRYVENQFSIGEYLYSFYFIIFTVMLTLAISVLLKLRHNLSVRISKRWFFCLGGIFFLANILYILNQFQQLLAVYPTSASLNSFISVYLIKSLINFAFLAASLVICGLAGEIICTQVFEKSKHISLLHYIKSNFYNRSVARSILLGYLLFLIFLGLQAGILYLGERYCGVWKEWIRLTELSTAYLPVLTALIIGLTASMREEITFRLFGIGFFSKQLKNTVLAVILTSFIWGLGHSAYAVFPVWFRVMEVGLLGLLFGFIFIKYGIIAAIVAHYLFDVFWGVSPYILGRASSGLLVNSLLILVAPLIFAVAIYLINKKEKEKEIALMLNKNEEYNLTILIDHILKKKSQGASEEHIRKELISHDWDTYLVDLALKRAVKGWS